MVPVVQRVLVAFTITFAQLVLVTLLIGGCGAGGGSADGASGAI